MLRPRTYFGTRKTCTQAIACIANDGTQIVLNMDFRPGETRVVTGAFRRYLDRPEKSPSPQRAANAPVKRGLISARGLFSFLPFFRGGVSP